LAPWRLVRPMRIDGHCKLAFVLGYPVAHSASPVMQQAALAVAGINAVYLPWAVPPDRLAGAVQGLRAMENLLGANVTVPHKEAIVPLLDSLMPEAEAVGAVNTVIPREGRLLGDNTDGAGFLAALRQELECEVRGLTVAILGAGGAARAVATALAQAGASTLILLNRTVDRATRLAELVASRHPACRVTVQLLRQERKITDIADVRLLVNTTSVGLYASDPPLFDYASLSAPILVCDLIYNPPETPLLQAARSRGCRASNGFAMLVHQGALAFERWTGTPAPIQAMREALRI